MIDERFTVKGQISSKWVSKYGGMPCGENHNALSYAASKVMAAAYGGSQSGLPKYIGFVFGPASDPAFSPISRGMTWDSVTDEITAKGANMLIQEFSRSPFVETEDNTSKVTFSAVTRSGNMDNYLYESPTLSTTSYMYRVVLLGDTAECSPKKVVLGMAELPKDGNNSYRQKPEGYELSVDWRISFN